MNLSNDHFVSAYASRREFLRRSGLGMGALGLATLLESIGMAPARAGTPGKILSPLSPREPHFPAKAKRVIHIFPAGGPSQVDTWDPKPLLAKYQGKALNEVSKSVQYPGAGFPSPFQFSKHGRSGIEVPEVFPHLAGCVDEMAVIRSMTTASPGHEQAMLLMNCGEFRLVRPSLGSWVTYGLGTENQNLPAFIALSPDRPLQGEQNWQSAFLPGIYQGTFIDTRNTSVDKLLEYIRSSNTSLAEQRRQLDLLMKLEAENRRRHQADPQLETRIQTFETAYRMQIEATDAFDITREPESVRKMYGDSQQARQILIARRLVERGVRFVQVWHGGWDNHNLIEKGIRGLAKDADQPIAALIKDLKARDMLKDTLVIWAGEFGRTPGVDVNQNVDQSAGKGRDHNNKGFSIWMAGGGVKGGTVYGSTDEFGYAAVDPKVDVPDLHATILQLLGFDHERLTFRHAGRDFRLTDVHGKVVKDVLA